MEPYRIRLQDIDRIELSYWLSYSDEHEPVYDYRVYLKPEAFIKPYTDSWYEIKEIYWSAYQTQLDHVRYTGVYRNLGRLVTPNPDNTLIISEDSGVRYRIDTPREIMQTLVERAIRAWKKTDRQPGSQGLGIFAVTERHIRFFTPKADLVWTDEAKEVYDRNAELAQACIERLLNLATNSSRNQADPVEVRIYRDHAIPESFFWVEYKPKEDRRLMSGGVVLHSDGKYEIHT